MQAKDGLNDYLNNSLVNKLIESAVPRSCQKEPCILGIDEAGRGPVLGPMTYGIAYYPESLENNMKKMKFADSKALSDTTRSALFESIQIKDEFKDIGYLIKIISPNMISNSMLGRKKYDLNSLSHDTAIQLINGVLEKGIKVSHVYIDTVGPPEKYKDKLRKLFPKINFTVCEKADSKYPIVSAASVCAKVMRDRIIENWKYVESDDLCLDTFKLGSGYPSDPETKKFIEESIDPVFGYPTIARFSWSTIPKAIEKWGSKCDWNEPEDKGLNPKVFSKQQNMMKSYFSVLKKQKTSGDGRASSSSTGVKSGPITIADKFFNDGGLERVSIFELRGKS